VDFWLTLVGFPANFAEVIRRETRLTPVGERKNLVFRISEVGAIELEGLP
jgi:hypothetical protein